MKNPRKEENAKRNGLKETLRGIPPIDTSKIPMPEVKPSKKKKDDNSNKITVKSK
jgi:hypothetical protein